MKRLFKFLSIIPYKVFVVFVPFCYLLIREIRPHEGIKIREILKKNLSDCVVHDYALHYCLRINESCKTQIEAIVLTIYMNMRPRETKTQCASLDPLALESLPYMDLFWSLSLH